EILKDFHRVYFPERAADARVTIITDQAGRTLIIRSLALQWTTGDNMKTLELEIAWFVNNVFPFTEAQMRGNARGPHFFSILGHDRQNKLLGDEGAWSRRNAAPIAHLFREGSMMRRIDAAAGVFMHERFPLIVKRIQNATPKIQAMFGDDVYPRYGRRQGDKEGVFYNFCINAPRPFENIPRVHCYPHVDHMNLAICVCLIFIYGNFNHRERCWLVIWEAGLIVELPPGVFMAYPSSLFYHWNVDVCDLDKAQFVTTTDGRPPNQEQQNFEPLSEEEQAWNRADGRGSMVWFNQATLFQSAELGVSTIKKAKKRGLDTHSDAQTLITKGLFPKAPVDNLHSQELVDGEDVVDMELDSGSEVGG
ncbi:hypothetical protein EV121DRAFT_274905, partial [Schizophyllum commune]